MAALQSFLGCWPSLCTWEPYAVTFIYAGGFVSALVATVLSDAWVLLFGLAALAGAVVVMLQSSPRAFLSATAYALGLLAAAFAFAVYAAIPFDFFSPGHMGVIGLLLRNQFWDLSLWWFLPAEILLIGLIGMAFVQTILGVIRVRNAKCRIHNKSPSKDRILQRIRTAPMIFPAVAGISYYSVRGQLANTPIDFLTLLTLPCNTSLDEASFWFWTLLYLTLLMAALFCRAWLQSRAVQQPGVDQEIWALEDEAYSDAMPSSHSGGGMEDVENSSADSATREPMFN